MKKMQNIMCRKRLRGDPKDKKQMMNKPFGPEGLLTADDAMTFWDIAGDIKLHCQEKVHQTALSGESPTLMSQ
jgi:hypothetical protein